MLIDKSVHFIQKLEKEFSLSLLDRQIFALKEDGGVKLISRKNFERMIEKEIPSNTLVFNNLIQSKRELSDSWVIPVSESWHGAISRKG